MICTMYDVPGWHFCFDVLACTPAPVHARVKKYIHEPPSVNRCGVIYFSVPPRPHATAVHVCMFEVLLLYVLFLL